MTPCRITPQPITANVYGADDVAILSGMISGLYDRNVSVTATTYTQTIDLGRNTAAMLGGVIQRHADGGNVASWLAEAGPELLDYPNGRHGMAYRKGVYNVPDGTYVHTAPATKGDAGRRKFSQLQPFWQCLQLSRQ